jgi:hypothetical protein
LGAAGEGLFWSVFSPSGDAYEPPREALKKRSRAAKEFAEGKIVAHGVNEKDSA